MRIDVTEEVFAKLFDRFESHLLRGDGARDPVGLMTCTTNRREQEWLKRLVIIDETSEFTEAQAKYMLMREVKTSAASSMLERHSSYSRSIDLWGMDLVFKEALERAAQVTSR